MGKGRLEAFSDGVIAIIITIIRAHGSDFVLKIYGGVALLWLIRDRRIEHHLHP